VDRESLFTLPLYGAYFEQSQSPAVAGMQFPLLSWQWLMTREETGHHSLETVLWS